MSQTRVNYRLDAPPHLPLALRCRVALRWIRSLFHLGSNPILGTSELVVFSEDHAASATNPRQSASTIAVPSIPDCKCRSSSSLTPDAELIPPPQKSSLSPAPIPQDNDPTTRPEGRSIIGLIDRAVRKAVPPTPPKTSVPMTGIFPPSYASWDDLVPDLTDQIRKGERVYSGQYSDVYQGVCGGILIAIKVIKSLPSDPLHAVRRRVRREVGTASRFDHPNVLSVCGMIEADWCQFGGIVSLWCPNGDACSYLRTKRLTFLARLHMLHGVVAGLEYIHSQSVVHGDLKPGNILIDASGNPLICDFGLVSILDTERPERSTDNTTTVHHGTVRYLAHELAQDPPYARTMASDIHALGCIAYEFLYLEKPYAARSGNAGYYIFKDIAAGIPPAHRPLPPLAPSVTALWYLLELCWDRHPYRRPIISTFSNSLRLLTEGDLQRHLL